MHLSLGLSFCHNSDGTAGGEVLEGNLIFNGVRESGDHGMFNSWYVRFCRSLLSRTWC